MTRTLTLLIAATLAFSAAAEDEVSIEPRRSTLGDQGIKGIEGLSASFLVKAKPAAVLRTLWDVKRFPEIFPDIEKMNVIEEKGDRIDVAFRVDAVIAKVRYTLRRRLDATKRTIRWRETAGDLKRIRGAWKVDSTGDPGVAKVTYESFVEVGGIVPTGLYRDLAMGKVKEMAGRVRKACER